LKAVLTFFALFAVCFHNVNATTQNALKFEVESRVGMMSAPVSGSEGILFWISTVATDGGAVTLHAINPGKPESKKSFVVSVDKDVGSISVVGRPAVLGQSIWLPVLTNGSQGALLRITTDGKYLATINVGRTSWLGVRAIRESVLVFGGLQSRGFLTKLSVDGKAILPPTFVAGSSHVYDVVEFADSLASYASTSAIEPKFESSILSTHSPQSLEVQRSRQIRCGSSSLAAKGNTLYLACNRKSFSNEGGLAVFSFNEKLEQGSPRLLRTFNNAAIASAVAFSDARSTSLLASSIDFDVPKVAVVDLATGAESAISADARQFLVWVHPALAGRASGTTWISNGSNIATMGKLRGFTYFLEFK
jgi:hypothetical protein